MYKFFGTILGFFSNICGGSYFLGLLLFAIMIKLILLPFGIKQQKNAIRQAKMKPKEEAIRKKYKGRNDQKTQQKMQNEIMEMYQAEGYNPAGGCLPMLVQLVIIMLLYQVIIYPLRHVVGMDASLVKALTDFSTAATENGGLGTVFTGRYTEISLLGELAKLKDIVAESIAQQRSRLLMKHKFIGGVVMHLEMIPVRDNRVRTAMTDGKHVYFDLAFYSELSDDERLFVLAHEAWHCVYMHMLRRKGRDPRIWNFATDMEINRMLENDHFTPPADVLFPDPKWKNGDTMSAEEMYELLLKDMKKAAKNTAKNSGMPMPGNGGSGSDNDTNDSEDDQQDGNGESADEKKYAKNSGKRGGKLKGQFDDHVYNGEDKEPTLLKEPLDYEFVTRQTRNYKS